jgi:predicted dehydrogenase
MPRHRILIVGVGSIGERHLRCFLATGRADVEFVEINPQLREAIADRYPAARDHAVLKSALEPSPDAAVIATPAQLHVPIATQLATAGAHLFIEKPLSTSEAGIDELVRIAEANRVRIGVAYVYRSHPILAAMRREIRSGRFGRPLELVCVSGQHFPTYRPAYRSIYYARRETGGGAIQDALTHLVNAGEWLVGPIDRLVVDAAHQVLDGVDVEDTVHLLARHGNVLGSYSLSQHQAPNETAITVICERGTVRIELHENRWRWMTEPGGAWQDEPFPPMERDELFVAQANQFLDVIEGRAEPLCTLEEARQTLRVNLAALKSLDEAAWQQV